MTNKDIARAFRQLADLMELHGENPYKVRSYQNAYLTLRRLDKPLSEMSDAEIGALKGVGKAIAAKIRELLDTGRLETLEKYRSLTPPGVQELLEVKGIGPKKVRTLWQELGVESPGELLYACNENRLVELKGFGPKTQEELRRKLEYFERSRNKFRYADVEAAGLALLQGIEQSLEGGRVSWAGELRRRCNVVKVLDFVVAGADLEHVAAALNLETPAVEDGVLRGVSPQGFPVRVVGCGLEEFGSKLFLHTAGKEFLDAFLAAAPETDFRRLPDEQAVFERAGLPFIAPELRDKAWAVQRALRGDLPRLLEEKDIRGVVHCHSTYSDGMHSLRQMATHARDRGFEYLVISDHSRSAFYANGLSIERLEKQWAEVEALNAELAPFRIFKGIESDILADGSLDYPDEVLARFDCVIASIHSNLRMDEEKATRRLLNAIENPHTRILGHPTGRLLLARQGYPIDHRRVIDACAANGVAIELNANPYRLDLDWEWIPYALEKGVLISINPDAHSLEGIQDLHFGVLSARKGALDAPNTLNAKNLQDFEAWLQTGKG